MKRVFVLFAIVLSVSIPSVAQVLYGSLTGIIQDSAASVVPGASLKLRNVGTGQELTERTNDVGSYTFSSLAPGTYELTISASGFRTVTQRGIAIAVNAVRREDVTLAVGQINESITVEAGQVTLQTDKADVHTELGSREMVNMPRARSHSGTISELDPGGSRPCFIHQRKRRQPQQ